MGNIKVRCIDQTIHFLNTPTISSGNVNYDTIVFEFCEKWTGFAKTAIFYRSRDEVYYQLLDENGSCVIPKEVLRSKGTFYVGVFGVLDDKTITSQVISYRVQEGAITDNLTPADPTPDIYEQILSRYNNYDQRLAYFEERFNGSVGDAEKFGGKLPEYYATSERAEAIAGSVDDIINGTKKAGDAEKLGGKSAEEYALITRLFSNVGSYANLDFDTATTTKMYSGSASPGYMGATNYPFNDTGLLIVESGTTILQRYITWQGLIYERTKLNASGYGWKEWKQTATTADLANYLPLDGSKALSKNLYVGATSDTVSHQIMLRNSSRRISHEIGSSGAYALVDLTNSKNIIVSETDGTNTFNGTANGNLPLTNTSLPVVSTSGNSVLSIRNSNSSGAYAWLVFKIGDTTKGSIGISKDGILALSSIDGSTYRILHSGNFSEYALPLNVGSTQRTITGSTRVPIKFHNSADDNLGLQFNGKSGNLGFLGVYGKDNPVFITADGANVRTLHHDGNSKKIEVSSTPIMDENTVRIW